LTLVNVGDTLNDALGSPVAESVVVIAGVGGGGVVPVPTRYIGRPTIVASSITFRW
jgi:hypothetical protein